MTEMQLSQRIGKVFGWLSLAQAEVLERLARGQVVLEIGSYFGKSTVAMAPVAKRMICIDYFRVKTPRGGRSPLDSTGRLIPHTKKPDTRDIFEQNVKLWRHKIEVHEMNSLDAVKLDWEPVGLLFIDGGHDTATVLNDCGFMKWVIIGGHVAFHDIGWKSVAKAVNQVLTNNPEWERVQEVPNMLICQRILPSEAGV